MTRTRHWIFGLVLVVGLTQPILAQRLAPAELAGKQGDRYPTVKIHGSKIGEDKARGVIYLDASQREQRRLLIRNGLVYDSTGKPLRDTRSKHKNQNNYVMDAAGNFYLFDEFTTPNIRHSSVFAGGPVAGAGNIRIKDGRIVYIDSDSGHYPTQPLFGNVLKELASCGVDTSALAGK